MFSSATQPLPPRHNFVVTVITFEGFRLRSSNLTYALLIQISRTSSIIDIVVPSKKNKVPYGSEMPLKVNFGHPKWPINLIWPEMRFKVIFRHPKWPPKKNNSVSIWNGQNCDRKWISEIQMADRSEMARNAKEIKVAYRSEMARNGIESEIRTSKMADVSQFVKN